MDRYSLLVKSPGREERRDQTVAKVGWATGTISLCARDCSLCSRGRVKGLEQTREVAHDGVDNLTKEAELSYMVRPTEVE